MGRWNVRQPNGRLARWSTIVDHFTEYDMTEAEAIESWLDDVGRKDATRLVREGIEEEPAWGKVGHVSGDGLDRYRRCIDTIARVHGEAEAKKTEAILSASPDAGRAEGATAGDTTREG